MAFLLNGPEIQEETVKMPVALFFKQLTMKMASLQSQRTQCCCCAISVFAAMFGIFMLSAGICIVLNVTFMEVDTSGLPPELHNEEGKKVVGIILICVSIATLGLSASVSVVYFVVCSRKPKPPAPPNPSVQPAQPGLNSSRQVNTQGNRTPGSVTPGHLRRSPGHTPSTDRHSRHKVSTADGQPINRSVSPQPPGRNSNPNNVPGPRHSRHRAPRKPQRRFKPGLPSHMEEDPEATRSVIDFQMHQQSRESSSTSGTSTSPSGQSILAGENRLTQGSHRKNSIPPVILIDDTSLPFHSSHSENDLAETQFVGDGHGLPTPDSVTFVTETNSYGGDPFHRHIIFHTTTSQDDSDMGTPPSLPYNIDVVEDDRSRDINLTPTPLSLTSHPPHKHKILLVQSQDSADQITPWSSTNTLDMVDLVQEENDHISDLPSQHFQTGAAVGPHEPSNRPSSSADDHNSRSESRASYNSAFSFNGEELEETMEEVKRRIEEMQRD